MMQKITRYNKINDFLFSTHINNDVIHKFD